MSIRAEGKLFIKDMRMKRFPTEMLTYFSKN